MSLLNNHKFLQNAIIVMSILIWAGLAILVHGLVKKSGGGASGGTVTISQEEATAEAPEGTVVVQLPPRSRVNHMAPYKNGIALHVANVSGNYVYFVNAQTGKIDGALKLEAQAIARNPLQR